MQIMMNTHPQSTTPLWLRRRHSWILRDAIHVRSETEKITLHLIACKCVGFGLTSNLKTCFPLESIAMELEPQTQ